MAVSLPTGCRPVLWRDHMLQQLSCLRQGSVDVGLRLRLRVQLRGLGLALELLALELPLGAGVAQGPTGVSVEMSQPRDCVPTTVFATQHHTGLLPSGPHVGGPQLVERFLVGFGLLVSPAIDDHNILWSKGSGDGYVAEKVFMIYPQCDHSIKIVNRKSPSSR